MPSLHDLPLHILENFWLNLFGATKKWLFCLRVSAIWHHLCVRMHERHAFCCDGAYKAIVVGLKEIALVDLVLNLAKRIQSNFSVNLVNFHRQFCRRFCWRRCSIEAVVPVHWRIKPDVWFVALLSMAVALKNRMPSVSNQISPTHKSKLFHVSLSVFMRSAQ